MFKPKPFTFRPPRNNRFIIALAKRLLPLGKRLGPRVAAVEVNEEGLRRLKQLKGQRVVSTIWRPRRPLSNRSRRFGSLNS
jgi:hypothetical protein